MRSMLLVCEGNICRSPMGEALFARQLPAMQVASAGLGALVGMPADGNAVELLRELGLDISAHRARQLNRDMCTSADVVLVMDGEQRQRITGLYPQVSGRVFRLGHHNNFDIPDPYRQGPEAFRQALSMIQRGVADWLPRIQKLQ